MNNNKALRDSIDNEKQTISNLNLRNSKLPIINSRQTTLVILIIVLLFLVSILVGSLLVPAERLASNLSATNHPPSLTYLFGTDWLGRDMLARTVVGLKTSLLIGFYTTILSLFISLIVGMLSAFSKKADIISSFIIDVFLSIPHLVLMIFVSVMMGRGLTGVTVAISLTHWAPFSRIIRSKVIEIQNKEYIQISYRFGKSSLWVALNHFMPHIVSNVFIGFSLIFPQVILHEASITFLGFGLPPHEPAIGIILSESLNYMTRGLWWLVIFPGFSLFLVVYSIYTLGNRINKILDEHTAHE